MIDRHEHTPVDERLVMPSQTAISSDLPTGYILAKQFRVEQKLGDGGMGTVYRCIDLTVQRVVAIKVLHPHLVSVRKWLLRFQQEARAIARLDHPNIVGVKQLVSQDGQPPFIVMDYIKGANLGDLLSFMGRLSPHRAVHIMSQVAEGLAHAHSNGVVHRDLKPGNIVLIEGTDDFVKILDFGIAKVDADDNHGMKLTQTGDIFGSPAYMSPEQWSGKGIDGRSDQYSFGCVLYECLTGTPPFMSTNAVDVMMQHLHDTPVPLSEATLGNDFPFGLERVVMRLLKKDPAERYQSMLHVKSAMNRAVSQNPELFETDEELDQRFVPVKQSRSRVNAGISFAIGSVVTAVIAYILVTFHTPSNQSMKPTLEEIKDEGAIYKDHLVLGLESPFARYLRRNGSCEYQFGMNKLGKLAIVTGVKNVVPGSNKVTIIETRREVDMQNSVVVPKDSTLGATVPVKIFDQNPVVLELFRGSNLQYLTIGTESFYDLVNDAESTGAREDTDSFQRACVYVAGLKNLKLLEFFSAPLDRQGLQYLNLDAMKDLKMLKLIRTMVDGKDLACSPCLKWLNCLDISGMKNVAAVARMLRSPHFYLLSAKNCDLTDADIKEIAQIPTLECLDVSVNLRLSGQCLRYLANTRVGRLDIVQTGIGPESISDLVRIKSLRYVNLSSNKWSKEQCDHLRKALGSRCNVEYEVGNKFDDDHWDR